jgi:predicted RNA-binding Zn ribbon-like protein
MPRQPVSWPAVAELTRDGTFACLDFVNSEWTDWRGRGEPTDRLGTPVWWERFLDHWGMSAAGLDAPIRGRLAELRKLRHIMRAVLQKGRRPTRTELAWLDRRLASSPHRWAIGSDRQGLAPRVVPARLDWQAVIAALILSFSQLVNDADRSRIKKCANPDCSYLFYDVSTNHSRRWCFSNVCGNLIHVREFRARGERR